MLRRCFSTAILSFIIESGRSILRAIYHLFLTIISRPDISSPSNPKVQPWWLDNSFFHWFLQQSIAYPAWRLVCKVFWNEHRDHLHCIRIRVSECFGIAACFALFSNRLMRNSACSSILLKWRVPWCRMQGSWQIWLSVLPLLPLRYIVNLAERLYGITWYTSLTIER